MTTRTPERDAKIVQLWNSGMTEWQPIETAPKDGRLILTFSPAAGKQGFSAIRINKWVHGTWWHTNQKYWPPTHWLPMPEPPT